MAGKDLDSQTSQNVAHATPRCHTNCTAPRLCDRTESLARAILAHSTKGRGLDPQGWPARSKCPGPGGSPATESLPLPPWRPNWHSPQSAQGPLRPSPSIRKPWQKSTEVSAAQSHTRTATSDLQAKEEGSWSPTLSAPSHIPLGTHSPLCP